MRHYRDKGKVVHDRKGNWLRQVLILSLVLNCTLLSLFFYFFIRESRLPLLFAFQPIEEPLPPLVERARQSPRSDELHALVQSEPFVAVRTLFARAQSEIEVNTLVKLILEGNDELLDAFYRRVQKEADFSPEQRYRLLCDYCAFGSQTAAYLLVMLDPDRALHLSDERLMHLVELLDQPTPEATAFMKKVIEMRRAPLVEERAYARLASFVGDEVAARYDRYHNNENLRPLFRQQVPITQTERTHIVQPGESLWLIARRYNVSIKKIMVVNNLRSTTLQPGEMLKIPPPDSPNSE